jgi:hypothetical protein
MLFDERGFETLEAAITLPIACMVLVGAVNLGMVAYAGQMAQEAARHGVRMGSVAQVDPIGVAVQEALNFAQATFSIGNPRVIPLAPGGVAGSVLRIRVTYEVPNLFGGLLGLFPGLPSGPFIVVGEAAMRQEGW